MSIFNLTEEEWEKIAYDSYLCLKNDKNNYSYWYEKVKDCGFNIVNSYIYQIPFEQYQNSHSENKERITRLFEVDFKHKNNITFGNRHCQLNIFDGEWGKLDQVLEPVIKTIVTAEQFAAMRYEVK